jgi:four helix bundle protein
LTPRGAPPDFRRIFTGMVHAQARCMDDQKINSFRDLEVWRLSMDLVDLVLPAIKQIPGTEFDMRRQIFKAVTSIPSNVAEGYRRKKRRGAYQNHVSIAMGSNGELQTEVEICARNSFMPKLSCENIQTLSDRVGAMLYRLHESLE